MESGLYFGWVKHRRFTPVEHAFRYRLFLVGLDLTDLPNAFPGSWTWSAIRPAIARFRRSDHLGDPQQPLAESVRDMVAATGRPRPTGKILLLTHLRYWGLVFNPVSFYFCLDSAGRWETMVAEVSNTPWGQVHCYVIDRAQATAAERASDTEILSEKVLHVSPFLSMDYGYRWDIRAADDHLTMHIENVPRANVGAGIERRELAEQAEPPPNAGGASQAEVVGDQASVGRQSAGSSASRSRAFNVTLSLQRRPMTRRWRWLALLRFPWMTAAVVWGIYWQALLLWWRKVPYVPHPGLRETGQSVPFGYRQQASVSPRIDGNAKACE